MSRTSNSQHWSRKVATGEVERPLNMTDGIHWRNALQRIGFAENQVGDFEEATGCHSVALFQRMSRADMPHDFVGIRSSSHKKNAFLIPTVREKALIAFRLWIEYKEMRNQTFTCDDFTNAVLERFLAYLVELKNVDAGAAQDRASYVCPKLESDSDKNWRQWDRLFREFGRHTSQF